MQILAGSLYLLSTLAFASIAAFVAARLIRSSRRAGHTPELALGAGMLLTATLGYGVMMFAIVARTGLPAGHSAAPILDAVVGLGWIFHNLGVMCWLRFIVLVFRPDEVWARYVVVAGGIVLWTGWGAHVALGGLESPAQTSGYWVSFAVIGGYPLWMAAEAFRYYVMMRKRLRFGMAEPLVTNRFLLWALASLSMAASIWTINLPSLLPGVVAGSDAERARDVTMLVTSLFGIGTVSIYWLTFFPPVWYERRLGARPDSAGTA